VDLYSGERGWLFFDDRQKDLSFRSTFSVLAFCGAFREDTMQVLENIWSRFETASELLHFFWQNKWWWLVPMVLMLLGFCVLILLAQGSAISPFIYTLF
jgi:hypothetical protein